MNNLKIIQYDGILMLELKFQNCTLTFLENIVQIVEILNENNVHDQQSITRKCIQMSKKENIWKMFLLNQVRY